MNIKKFLIGTAISTIMLGVFATGVFAAPSFTLFGGASNVAGEISLVSDLSNVDPADDFSGIRFDGTLPATLAGLATLSVDYNVTDDDCAGGSPRFQVRVDMDMDGVVSAGDKNVFVYLGPLPSFTGCTPNTWVSSGNLVTDPDLRWDTGQVGGTFYDSYANATTLTAGKSVLRISLVVDSAWVFGDSEQTVLVDNAVINSESYDFTLLTPSNKDECKNGGWMSFNYPFFKNQGDCVSYVQSNVHAVANKTK